MDKEKELETIQTFLRTNILEQICNNEEFIIKKGLHLDLNIAIN